VPATATPVYDIPAGKALFVVTNYSGSQWNINFANYLLVVPPRQVNEEYAQASLVVDPGSYAWQAHTPDGRYFRDPATGGTEFTFTVAAGEVYQQEIH
jgi:hypothetical protein